MQKRNKERKIQKQLCVLRTTLISVVYFDQHLGDAHFKPWSTPTVSAFFVRFFPDENIQQVGV